MVPLNLAVRMEFPPILRQKNYWNTQKKTGVTSHSSLTIAQLNVFLGNLEHVYT